MSGLYTVHKVYTPGEILTAADLNSTDQRHLTFNVATAVQGYSQTLEQSRLQADASTLSLSVADELARLREKIRVLGGKTYWDEVTGPAPLALTQPLPKVTILLPLEGAMVSDNAPGNGVPAYALRGSFATIPAGTVQPRIYEVVYDFDPNVPQYLMWKFTTPLGYKPGEIIELIVRVSMADNVTTGNLRVIAGLAPVIDMVNNAAAPMTGGLIGPDDQSVPSAWGLQKEYRVSLPTTNVTENQKCIVVMGFFPAVTNNAPGRRRLESASLEFSRGNFVIPPAGMTNPMTTIGDMVVGYNTGTPMRLGVGTTGQVLTVTGGLPQWGEPTVGMTNPMTTFGDLIFGSSVGTPTRLPIGTENQVLAVVSGAPTWKSHTVITALGDLIVGDTAGLASRLPRGTTDQILSVGVSGDLVWATPSTADVTNPMTSYGDLIVGGAGGVPERLGMGTFGYYLKSEAGAITWAPLPIDPGFASPMAMYGDLIVGGTAGAPARLPAGATNTWLHVVAGTVQWDALPIDPGFANPMTAAGDLIIGGTSGAATRLAKGIDTHVLTLVAGVPAWSPPTGGAGGGMTNPMTTLGDIITGGASGASQRLGIGSNTQVLTVVGGVPVWQAPVSGGMTNPMTGVGDLIRGGTSGAATRLAPGSNGTWLTLTAGVPAWASLPVDPGFANPMTGVGDLIRGGTSGAPTRLAVGSNGTWLTLTGGVPTWSALPVDPGFANPMTTSGDIIYGAASGAPTRLAKGTDGLVLKLASGIPSWAADIGFANPMTTAGDIIYGGASGVATRAAVGTAGFVLTVVGTTPTWAAPSVKGTGITEIVSLTQAAYDALGTKVATTLYVIS